MPLIFCSYNFEGELSYKIIFSKYTYMPFARKFGLAVPKEMSEETDNRRVLLGQSRWVLLDQPSCTNVLQILLRKDLVSLKPTMQRGQRSDPESIRASCSPHWTSLGMMTVLLRSEAVQWPIAKKSLCSVLWANQTPELRICVPPPSCPHWSFQVLHDDTSWSPAPFPDKQINAALFQITVWWSLFISF